MTEPFETAAPAVDASHIPALLVRWETRALDALPADAMLINKHIRELREALATAPKHTDRLTNQQQTELLDWITACQASYHIEETPAHRFHGLGGPLAENRAGAIEFVNSILKGETA